MKVLISAMLTITLFAGGNAAAQSVVLLPANVVNNRNVVLTWTASFPSHFQRILRCVGIDCTPMLISTSRSQSGGVGQFIDKNVGREFYRYQVVIFDKPVVVGSSRSNIIEIALQPPPPPPPVTITSIVSQRDFTVMVTWDVSAWPADSTHELQLKCAGVHGLNGFGDGDFKRVALIKNNGNTYSYGIDAAIRRQNPATNTLGDCEHRIISRNPIYLIDDDDATSDVEVYNVEQAGITPPPPPPPPDAPNKPTTVVNDDRSITVNWQTPETYGRPILRYEIRRRNVDTGKVEIIEYIPK